MALEAACVHRIRMADSHVRTDVQRGRSNVTLTATWVLFLLTSVQGPMAGGRRDLHRKPRPGRSNGKKPDI